MPRNYITEPITKAEDILALDAPKNCNFTMRVATWPKARVTANGKPYITFSVTSFEEENLDDAVRVFCKMWGDESLAALELLQKGSYLSATFARVVKYVPMGRNEHEVQNEINLQGNGIYSISQEQPLVSNQFTAAGQMYRSSYPR